MPTRMRRTNPAIDIETRSNVYDLKKHWEALLDVVPNPNPFSSWEWLVAWWEHFGVDNIRVRPYFLIIREEKEVVGIVPLYFRQPHKSWSRSEFRVAGNYGWHGGGTEEPIFLVKPGKESLVAEAVFSYLHNGQHGEQWDLAKIAWQQQPTNLEEISFRFLGRLTQQEGRQIVALPDSWKSYRARLSKSMKSNLSYYPHRLEKAGHSFRVRFLDTPETIGEGIDHLIRLHRQRAKSRRGPRHIDHLGSARNTAFVSKRLAHLAQNNQACVALLEINGAVVAAQAYLRKGPELVFYYSGFETKWYDFSPLTILTAEIIKKAIKDGVTRLNFLTHPTPFRLRWNTTTETTIYIAYIVRSHPRAFVAHILEMMRQTFSRIVGRGPEAVPEA